MTDKPGRLKSNNQDYRSASQVPPANELKRQIGLRTATALVVGEVIAVDLFHKEHRCSPRISTVHHSLRRDFHTSGLTS